MDITTKGPDHAVEVWAFFVPNSGGESGIRTHDEVAPIPVFETGAFVHSAISPRVNIIADDLQAAHLIMSVL